MALLEGVQVVGSLGVLLGARKRGVVQSLRETIGELQTTAGFRVSESLKTRLLREARERSK